MPTLLMKFTPMVEVLAAPIAPDEAISQPFHVPPTGATVTPVITQGGSPVTADSLTVVDQPVNGTAVVSGLSLVYTPNEGFAGPDAFHYFATVGGVDSNTATVNTMVTLAALGTPIQKQNRLIAYVHDDTTLDCYCRTDQGAMDLSGYDLTAHVRPYNRPQPFGQDYGVGWPGIYVPYHTEFPAIQIAVGHVQFTIDHGTLRQRMGQGLWRLHVTATNPATQARTRVYTALLALQ